MHFQPDEPIDVVFVSCVAQFIDKDTFFKKLSQCYAGARIIAVRTFFKPPEPLNVSPITFYEEGDVKRLPGGFDHYEAKTWSHVHADMRGNQRLWFEIDLLAVKTS